MTVPDQALPDVAEELGRCLTAPTAGGPYQRSHLGGRSASVRRKREPPRWSFIPCRLSATP